MKKSNLLCVLACLISLNGCMSHYEDLNGEDKSLNTITNSNIIKRDIGSTGVTRSQTSFELGNISISSGIKIYSNKFSGVYEVMYNNYIFNSSFYITGMYLRVHSGNFQFSVVKDDKEIIHTFNEGDSIDYYLDNIKGYISFRIAGESASFDLVISSSDYDMFTHTDF